MRFHRYECAPQEHGGAFLTDWLIPDNSYEDLYSALALITPPPLRSLALASARHSIERFVRNDPKVKHIELAPRPPIRCLRVARIPPYHFFVFFVEVSSGRFVQLNSYSIASGLDDKVPPEEPWNYARKFLDLEGY